MRENREETEEPKLVSPSRLLVKKPILKKFAAPDRKALRREIAKTGMSYLTLIPARKILVGAGSYKETGKAGLKSKLKKAGEVRPRKVIEDLFFILA